MVTIKKRKPRRRAEPKPRNRLRQFARRAESQHLSKRRRDKAAVKRVAQKIHAAYANERKLTKQAISRTKKLIANTARKMKLRKTRPRKPRPRKSKVNFGTRKLPKLRFLLGRPKRRKRIAPKKSQLKPLQPALRRRIQIALRGLREGRDLEASAQSAGISGRRLRKLLIERKLAREHGGQWIPNRRGSAQIMVYSDGKQFRAKVTRRTASIVGGYLSAVGQFLETNDIEPLQLYVGQSIKDVNGHMHPFETRPNVLYRLTAAVEPFEEIYRLLV